MNLPSRLLRTVRSFGLLLAAGFLLLDLGCALEHPEFSPPHTTCSSTIVNRTTGLRVTVSNSMEPFSRAISSCDLAASRDLWDRAVAGRLASLCAPGAPTSRADHLRYCTPNDWCRVVGDMGETRCSGELVPAAFRPGHCSTIPPVSPLAECPTILGEPARLTTDLPGLDFGTVPVGELRTLTVTLGNGGSGPLTVFPPTLEQVPGDTNSFASFPDPIPMTDCRANPANPAEVRAGGALLGAGGRASCSIQVRFQPNFGGTKRMSLLIPNNGTTASARLEVTGVGQAGTVRFTGLDPRAPRPALCLNVAPEMTPDGFCRTRSFTLQALGAAVRVREVQVPTGYRLIAPASVPLTVPRDGSLTLTVRTCLTSPPAATLRLNTNADPGMFSLELEPPASGCLP